MDNWQSAGSLHKARSRFVEGDQKPNAQKHKSDSFICWVFRTSGAKRAVPQSTEKIVKLVHWVSGQNQHSKFNIQNSKLFWFLVIKIILVKTNRFVPFFAPWNETCRLPKRSHPIKAQTHNRIAFFVECSVHRTENPQSIHPDKTYSGITKAKDIQRHPLEHPRALLRSRDRIHRHDHHGKDPDSR